jgi:hypothetical protein
MAISNTENKKQKVIITQVGIYFLFQLFLLIKLFFLKEKFGYENRFDLLAKQMGKDEKTTKEAFLSLEHKGLIGRHRFGKLKKAGETVYLCPPVNKTPLSADEAVLLDFFTRIQESQLTTCTSLVTMAFSAVNLLSQEVEYR